MKEGRYLLENYRYDPFTGRIKNSKGIDVGSYTRKYPRIFIKKKQYSISRLCWFLYHGKWPDGEIDHINGDTHDNRLSNIRDVNRCDNMKNRGKRSDNSSGKKGVWIDNSGSSPRYRAKIHFNGSKIYLGQFASVEEAAAAYDKAAKIYHKEFARTNSSNLGE